MATKPSAERRFRAVVAGGGVAGLEAMLALRALAGDAIEITLVTPGDVFEFRPLQTAEPFGLELPARLDLAPMVADAGAIHERDALAAVDPASRVVRTEGGRQIAYDALLVAPGARPVESVPGALSFSGAAERARFRELLDALGAPGSKRLAIIVPPGVSWAIAAYELALLSAAEREGRGLGDAELVLVTVERAPLELLGEPASQLVAARLEEAGVEVRAGSAARSFADGLIRLDGGGEVAADHAVALPRLEVGELPGLPQRANGFVGTDVRMHVDGLEDVWAAGDVTSFAIKQGGLAAQQADVAARAIAARAGVHVPLRPFVPVLRAALITGRALEFMRSGGPKGVGAGARALWSPPTKVAGAYLGPLLARAAGGDAAEPTVDLEISAEPDADEAERESAIALLLAAADSDAAAGEQAAALRWLEVVEEMDLVLPPEYVAKRRRWRGAV